MNKKVKLLVYSIGISLLCVLIFVVPIGINKYNTAKIVKHFPETYLSFLNNHQIDEAFNSVHFEPENLPLRDALKSDYKKYPPKFENITIGFPKRINSYLYQMDLSYYSVVLEEDKNFRVFVVHDEDSWIFILNQYNIPEKYLKNYTFVEKENHISTRDVIQESLN